MKRFTPALLSFLLVISAAAQSNPDTDSGVVPFGGVSGGDFDHIGIGNGGLFFKAPVVAYKQRGQLRLSFSLQYSSKSWSVNGPGRKVAGVATSRSRVTGTIAPLASPIATCW